MPCVSHSWYSAKSEGFSAGAMPASSKPHSRAIRFTTSAVITPVCASSNGMSQPFHLGGGQAHLLQERCLCDSRLIGGEAPEEAVAIPVGPILIIGHALAESEQDPIELSCGGFIHRLV